MIPYNPSSFDTNKTILEQILELKNWLKEHPSYRIFASSENGNTSMTSTYDLTQVEENADLNVGDVVLFHNGCVGCVSSVDRDNNEFDCNYPCTNIKGPQGPRGYVTSITNIQVDSNGDLQVTIYNPDTQSSSTYNAGHVVGADGTNGTNGVDGASVTNAQIDASGDLEITIYDPATSTSTTTNVGHVVGTDGQGMQVINTTTSTGTLSASDLAKANGTDDCILIFTDNGADLTMQRILKDSSSVYFYAHFVDTGKASFLLCEVNAVTGAYTISGGDLPIKASNIDSDTATNGQVLTADGSGGASWQNAGGGSTLYEHNILILENNSNWVAKVKIINNSATQITDKSTIRSFLSDNGFSSINNYFIGTGFFRTGGVSYLVLGLFTNSPSNLSFTVLDTSYIYGQQNFWAVNVTITDIVRTL